MGDDTRLIECGSVAVIYADGIAGVFISEPNVRLIYFEFKEIGGERVRCPVIEIVRPLMSFQPGHLQRLIAQSRAKTADVIVVH